MIYWYTGQPGHGKTLHGIDHALRFKDEGRLVFAANIREFDYDKAGLLEMTPENFRDWMNFLPDGAVALVDEVYEHGMLPKRPPGSKVPLHVQELAKHRHRGIDFIFICQSPAKQVDEFVHDLIENHTHVRRRFGLPFAHLRIFDRYERNPEKAHPLILKRVKLPKRPMGLYKSTELDTTQRKIPWYFIAAPLLLAGIVFGAFRWFAWLDHRGDSAAQTPVAGAASTKGANGASATVATDGAKPKPLTTEEYVQQFIPRVGSQPWSAPVYDGKLATTNAAPRVFCISSGAGMDGVGKYRKPSCTCLTEQGTRYDMEFSQCEIVAKDGQYEPFRDEKADRTESLDSSAQRERLTGSKWDSIDRANAEYAGVSSADSSPAAASDSGSVAKPVGGSAMYQGNVVKSSLGALR